MRERDVPNGAAGKGRAGALLLGTLCLIAACTQSVQPPPAPVPPTPPGVAALAERLGGAPPNAVVRLQTGGVPVGLAEVGTTYTAASGRVCRRLNARINNERVQAAICESAGRWTFAQPLTNSMAADQLMSGQVRASG